MKPNKKFLNYVVTQGRKYEIGLRWNTQHHNKSKPQLRSTTQLYEETKRNLKEQGYKKEDIFKISSKEFKKLKEDLEFTKRTEEAWKRYDRGKFISMSGDEFLKELKKW